jgi:tetratricopeptide (TPR) repeat protein
MTINLVLKTAGGFFNFMHQLSSPSPQNNFEQAKIFFLRGMENYEKELFEEAERYLLLSLELLPERLSTITNLSSVLIKLGKIERANEIILKALNLHPNDETLYLNQGLIFEKNKNWIKALESYEKAIKCKYDYAEAYQNRGNVLQELELVYEAIESYRLAIKFKPDFALPWTQLGYLNLDLGESELSYQAFKNAHNIQAIQKDSKHKSIWPISVSKIKHEYEQLNHIISKNIKNDKVSSTLNLLADYAKSNSIAVEAQKKRKIIDAVDTCHYFPDLEFSGKALAQANYSEIESQYLNSKLRLVVIDNFLTDEALYNLRQFCEEANIWKRAYRNGYLGAFIDSGFCSRVLLTIALELKRAMPNVIGANKLFQAWGFKYDQKMTGINLHADFAKVNVNFWITPDEACLDKTSGGMVVYDTLVPNNWTFQDYNTKPEKLEEYLKLNNSNPFKIPYKMNRCVVFDSAYIHNTDSLAFNSGYQNRRVNCTLLYGKQLMSQE